MKNNYADFKNFTEDQFAENEFFQQWVKYEAEEQQAFWTNYLQLFPQQKSVVLAAKKKVEASFIVQQLQPLSKEEKQALKTNIFETIGKPIKSSSSFQQKSMQLLRFAAIVIGIVMMPVYFLNKQSTTATLFVKRTGDKQTSEFILPDSTVVVLNANSSITYSKEINNAQSREVTLQGNAFFKVKKKAGHTPFTVNANTLSITVLGTEFNVTARHNATAIVLTTGKVKVSLNDKNATAIYMAPGEKVQLDTLQKTLIKSAANTTLYSAWTQGVWNFSATSLLDITNLLYDYYGIETVYKNEKAKQLKVSAVIPITDLASFINILSKTLDIKIIEKLDKLYVQF